MPFILPDDWSPQWTYGIVSEFLRMAEALAYEKEESIKELRKLFQVIMLGNGSLPEATQVLEDYYNDQMR